MSSSAPHPAFALSVEPLQDAATWDAFVHRSEQSSFCHLAGWRTVMREVMGHDCPYLIARDPDGELHGVLPLVRVRSRLVGHYLLSMPFLNYGGPLGTPAAERALTDAAVAEARRSGADVVELRARHPVNTAMETSDRKVTVVLPLPDSVDALWKKTFKAKLRSQVRRPTKAGMEARFGPDQVEAFYRVFARNMRDLGTPVLPRRFFERLRDVFADRVLFGAVYTGDEPVAGGCGFTWGDEFEMTWASSLREYNRQSPNMLLYSAAMEEMIGRGVRAFNFGRCTPGEGTHRFKRQWGGEDEPLPWAQWSAKGASVGDDQQRPVFQAAVRAWRRLPMPIANRLGPVLARRLPM